MEEMCMNCAKRHLCLGFDLIITESFNADLSIPITYVCKDYSSEILQNQDG